MLTDKVLRNLKPREKAFKVADRDGMYVNVSPAGTLTFRYDYRLNGRRETLTIGRYDTSLERTREPSRLAFGMSLSLVEARTLLAQARHSVEVGVSPSRAKVEKRADAITALTFGGWAQKYFAFKADPKSGNERLADSTLAMRKSIYIRALEAKLGKLKLEEITSARLKALCDDLKESRGPAVAVQARELVLNVFRHAQDCGVDTANPAEAVRPKSIATFKPRDRALKPEEITKFLDALGRVATTPTLRLALKFVLLTGVRKGEFIGATWDEIDFEGARWVVPATRMKAGREHIVYLSEQALDILVALRSCFGASRYLHPGRYDSDAPISNATLNRVIDAAVAQVRKVDPDFESFSVHDLRRTYSTALHRAKFDDRWIELSLAHTPSNVIAATYNTARYTAERRVMMQCWAVMIDCWTRGESAREVIIDAKRRAAEVPDLEVDEDL